MRSNLTPQTAAITGLVLALPFAVLFAHVILGREPDFGPLQPLLTSADPDQPNVRGTLIALSTVLLVLAAFVLNLMPTLRAVRAGGSIAAHPANLILAIVTCASILMVIGSIVVDQYPCWIGVPNCD